MLVNARESRCLLVLLRVGTSLDPRVVLLVQKVRVQSVRVRIVVKIVAAIHTARCHLVQACRIRLVF